MNSNWGLVDPLQERVRDKKVKRELLAERAQSDLLAWMKEHSLKVVPEATAAIV